MSSRLSKILAADIDGREMRMVHEYATIALAGATPISVFSSKGETLEKIADHVLGIAIPIHSHIALNACVTDYVPKAAKGAVRGGVLGVSALTFIGLLHLNLFGDGITQSVKGIWNKPQES
mmetsp:Transcript_28082/g.51848  ORF Transcript_28082/g.51848 Transcript_28082/m.51848 type:complete len:121 (-) Transcript_28082:195-557(-)|eukprot:CAMPEP_0175042664 /NCGR_PEP_ID=MMETSP0052_2-20121109/2705_1 /TAXON_ID=51329 ORGANISM="Polytomella parva, Strain SAG 63-3" /NCGR_SAMPLE_ID=MMETSP0052_2 /ASSEMBLY_ACC=CAM_ASM_000194 /LENGTH=120 /DNA_ID=CAMNT_0016305533 /DNA_START=97 /DNA_END=459 /DNA_ORIENTATION=-